jgi:hypothetical protein
VGNSLHSKTQCISSASREACPFLRLQSMPCQEKVPMGDTWRLVELTAL